MRALPFAIVLALGMSSCGEAPPPEHSSVGVPDRRASPAPPAPAPSAVTVEGLPDEDAPHAPGLGRVDYVEHIRALSAKLPAGFNIRVEEPFVVIGNQPPDVVSAEARRTVRWAVDHLRADFFDASPKQILDVWLFGDAPSYEAGVTALTGTAPDTPYGFYSSTHKGLFMNIGTGGGTLVHEIVHPFIEANFPSCPAWLNEGLGSLYEQCGEKDGHIYGYVNWRLPGLQRAIKAGQVGSFKDLLAMKLNAFYGDDRGVNYAQARYLCYYLQEKGLLLKFYKQFHANQKSDPTGYESLKSVLGETDMYGFQRKWEKYVMGLSQEFSMTLAN